MKEAEDKSLQALQKDWHDVWDGGTYSTHEEALSLRALLDLGTYYSITDRAWWMYVTRIIQKLGKTDRKTTLLKIGCGAGALLRVLEPLFDNLWGVDYSAQQIEVCGRALPSGHFSVCEACDINFDAGFFDTAYYR